MMPFSFFISREPVYETIAPAVSDNRISDIARMPCKTSRQVSEGDLYFGLDLDASSSVKRKKALIKN